MLINELKCIEILLKYIYNNQSVKPQITKDFTSSKDFERAKINLFNLVSINTLLSNYNEKDSFDLDLFVRDGIIPNVYETDTPGPTTDFRYNNSKDFIKSIVEALKEGNYTFDEDSNVFISNKKVETVISTGWLYCFAHAYKATKYQRMFLFNKKEENSITSEGDLINYLNHTKTFIVELTTQNNKKRYENVFQEAQNKTNNAMKNKNKVSVDEVIEYFKNSINPSYNVEIKKYKLPSSVHIIKKANEMGIDFYSLSLNKQKELINDWIMEYLNCNDYANDITQEFLASINYSNSYTYPYDKIELDKVLISLISVYLKILKEQKIDFYQISLKDFNIKEYMSPERQAYKEENKIIVKAINKLNESEEFKKIKEEYNSKIDEISQTQISGNKELLVQLITEYQTINDKYMHIMANLEELRKRRNIIDMKLKLERELSDITFENDKIYELLCETIDNGRVYVDLFNKKEIVFELYNATLGCSIFKATIPIDKLMSFVENNNYSIEENKPVYR